MGRGRLAVLITLLVGAALVACNRSGSGSDKPTVRIGATTVPEQAILAELYGQTLEANGYRVERRLNLGTREVVAPALESGQIDMSMEYLATYLSFVTQSQVQGSPDPAETQRSLQQALQPKGLTVLDFAPAVNTNGVAVTQTTSVNNNILRVSDLVRFNGRFVMGGPPECPTRQFCLVGLKEKYGLDFKEFKALDVGGPITVTALETGQVDVAILFTTDPALKAKNFVLLDDDKNLQLADNIAPVVRNDLVAKAPVELKTILNSVTTKVTTQDMTDLNRQVGLDRKDAKDVAKTWLRSKSLVK
jgi:osmoprotectant transport system substrate-binding protein